MTQPQAEQPSRRVKLTLAPAIADRLDAYAQDSHQPPATAAAGLMLAALDRIGTPEGAELLEARRQVQELTARVEALRRQLAERAGGDQVQQPAPRWEWPLDVLLSDAEWWDRWLPACTSCWAAAWRPGGPVPAPGLRRARAAASAGAAGRRARLQRSPRLPVPTDQRPAGDADLALAGLCGGRPHRRCRRRGRRHAVDTGAGLGDRHPPRRRGPVRSGGDGRAWRRPYLRLRAEAEITGRGRASCAT